MKAKNDLMIIHPKGERNLSAIQDQSVVLDTHGNRVRVVWDSAAEVTQFGQLSFFIEFLKKGLLFESWVENCPLSYESPNAPEVRDILGTVLLSLLAGHKRYAHITSIRSDQVNPGLLGMTRVMSEDSVRRGLGKIDAEAGSAWLKKELSNCYGELLREPWILDIDTTVKPLYGHQEGAVVGYNPAKPGRPSHVYHTYVVGQLRMILDAEVQAGNQSSSLYAQTSLWNLIDSLPVDRRPKLVRGDCGWGNERTMHEAKSRDIKYLFKLKQTRNVKRLISRSFSHADWSDAGQGWEGFKTKLGLDGWTQQRPVVVLRRRLKENLVLANKQEGEATQLAFIEIADGVQYEYAVLVTSLEEEVFSLAQLYRDRADVENVFDEMKNQWSWGGYTTKDITRCQLMARISSLVFNWWSIYTRLVFPAKHHEALTSRPLLLHSVGRQTRHAGQKTITVTSSHGRSSYVATALRGLNKFFSELEQYAEQLKEVNLWTVILSRAFSTFLQGRIIGRGHIAICGSS